MIGIFGGSGFIGRNLVDHLAAQSAAFTVFSRRPVQGFSGPAVLMDFENPATYVEYLGGLTCAILLVSASVPGTYAEDLPSEIEKNVLPYARFFKAIEGTAISRVVYLSSGGTVYGLPRTDSIDETHPTDPISPYGCGKLMIENLIKTTAVKAPWTYTILRPSNAIGRYQTAGKGQGLVAKVVEACLTGEELEIWGDGSTIRDYFDVRDLCLAISMVLNGSSAHNSVFNVGSGAGRTVLDVIQSVKDVIGVDVTIRFKSARSEDVNRNVLNINKIFSIGWQPTNTFESSISEICATRDHK